MLAEAQALARELADGPTFAHAVTKRQLDAEWAVIIETALDMEAEAQAECMQTNDFKRAYQAFKAKHQPVFRGDDDRRRRPRLALFRGAPPRACARARGWCAATILPRRTPAISTCECRSLVRELGARGFPQA